MKWAYPVLLTALISFGSWVVTGIIDNQDAVARNFYADEQAHGAIADMTTTMLRIDRKLDCILYTVPDSPNRTQCIESASK